MRGTLQAQSVNVKWGERVEIIIRRRSRHCPHTAICRINVRASRWCESSWLLRHKAHEDRMSCAPTSYLDSELLYLTTWATAFSSSISCLLKIFLAVTCVQQTILPCYRDTIPTMLANRSIHSSPCSRLLVFQNTIHRTNSHLLSRNIDTKLLLLLLLVSLHKAQTLQVPFAAKTSLSSHASRVPSTTDPASRMLNPPALHSILPYYNVLIQTSPPPLEHDSISHRTRKITRARRATVWDPILCSVNPDRSGEDSNRRKEATKPHFCWYSGLSLTERVLLLVR